MRIVSNVVPFGAMFRQVKRRQGLNKEAAELAWQEYKKSHPNLSRMRERPFTFSEIASPTISHR